MLKKLLWGLGVLVLLLCTALVFMTVRNLAEIRQLKEEADAIEKSLEDGNKPKPVVKVDEQPAAEEGFKWVWHNDHWDKVPNQVEAPSVTVQNEAENRKTRIAKFLKEYNLEGLPPEEQVRKAEAIAAEKQAAFAEKQAAFAEKQACLDALKEERDRLRAELKALERRKQEGLVRNKKVQELIQNSRGE